MTKVLNLPNVKIDSNGDVTEQSLSNVLQVISRKAGKRGRISAAYIKVENKYEEMLKFAQHRMGMNSNPNRERYDIISYSCIHFIKGVMTAAGVDTPWMLDPRSISYIEEIQEDHPALKYRPSDSKFIIKEPAALLGF